MKLNITRDTRIVFIGDSITDSARRTDKDGLGGGYVRLIRDYLAAKDPTTAPVVINSGISGNRVPDLLGRWQADVIDLKPDVLSIKIGINDVWHGLGGKPNGVPIDKYIATYRDMLKQTVVALPKCALVLCEPSIISPPQPAEGNDTLKPYVKAVNDLAQEFNAATVVNLHDLFLTVTRQRPDIVWTSDGVHPTSTGHMLIARAWLQATGLL